MFGTGTRLIIIALACVALLAAHSLPRVGHAQGKVEREFRADMRRALTTRGSAKASSNGAVRQSGYVPVREKQSMDARTAAISDASTSKRKRASLQDADRVSTSESYAALATRIRAGTPLGRVLHTSQLSLTNTDGTNEQFTDQTRDLVADEQTTFDSFGGSFDIALGRSGARYEVYSSVDKNGTSTTADDVRVGVLEVALDTNGDYIRDNSTCCVYDLERDFGFPSAASVVAGTSKTGREFVVVSSSGYYNQSNPNDPANEPSAGVVLLVRDTTLGGFDTARTRTLVAVGSNQLNNANALALLPNNELLIADFDSNELRIVRDTNADGIPDTLDPVPYYSYRFSDDAPLDVAVNSRGVVFSHSFGNDTVLLALYDDNGDGRADRDEVVVEGLSLDNTLLLHGLAVDREGTVYVIEDASGADDTSEVGGNGGAPRIDAFPDPSLNGFLLDGKIYARAEKPGSQALSGISFGVDTSIGPVGHLTLVNSASLLGNATRDGLGTITGAGLTRGARGSSEADARARGLTVRVEGRDVPVLTFSDSQVNIYVPQDVGTGVRSVVVTVGGNVTAADDVVISNANPGLFTTTQAGTGEAIALLTSAMRYTAGPFERTTDGQPSVIALFGTGWRNSLPVTVRVNGQPVTVQYAGPSGGFPGLDQLNIVIPANASGTNSVTVTTASNATSRNGVVITVK